MAEKIKSYPKRKWWMEEGEELDSARRMKEAVARKKEYFDLKAGSDGKDQPSITTKYTGKVGSKKKVVEKKVVAKKYVEADEFEDEDEVMDDDMGMEMEAGINDEADVIDTDDEVMGDMGGEEAVCTCPNCGAKLVIEAIPEDEDEGMEDEGMEDEMGDSDMMDAESEEDDMTVPKLESKKDKFNKYAKKVESKKKVADSEESFEEAYKKWKEERRKRLEAMKAKKRKVEAESEIGVEYGSDTKGMVGPGKTKDGQKTDVGKGNDDCFAPQSSSTSDMVGPGKAFSGQKASVSANGVRTSEKKVVAKKAMAEEEAVSDPFEDENDLEGNLGGDLDYADIPVDVGADPDSIEKYEAVQKRRKARDMKESTSMKEAFEWKKLVRGEYK